LSIDLMKRIKNFKIMKEYFLKLNNDGSLNRGYLSVWENGNDELRAFFLNSIEQILKGSSALKN